MIYEKDVVEKQYSNDRNLDIRIKLHELFSTNKYGWSNWVFDQMEFLEGMKVLELGCGNADFWVNNWEAVPGIDIILTDLSEGMIEAAQKRLENKYSDIDFKVADAQNIPYEDNSFDVVIANHMIYHIPDIEKAIGEMYRVLKPNGKLYTTTMGKDNMSGLYEILKSFDNEFIIPETALRFGLETGGDLLGTFFENIDMRRYEDSLDIKEAEPLIEYIISLDGMNGKMERMKKEIEDLKTYLEGLVLKENGIKIKKDSGIFITTKESLV